MRFVRLGMFCTAVLLGKSKTSVVPTEQASDPRLQRSESAASQDYSQTTAAFLRVEM
jgi:hypothetical protein